ncbi:MAG TPA: LysM peptidoglycan-binding domain-containing protein [Chloroflexota bacterium]
MKGKTAGGPERFILSLALLVPLAFAFIGIQQLASVSLAAPSLLALTDQTVLSTKPIVTRFEVPPTLAAPTATPRPTATPAPSPTPRTATYVVKPGDELKHIAADYKVDIFKLIKANDIPNPDSLRIGQVLRIPDD